MKRYYIPTFVVSLILSSVLLSCTEEKTFVFEGYEIENVAFTVINPAFETPDTVWSSRNEGGDYASREIKFYYSTTDGSYHDQYRVYLDYKSETWMGGYNPVTITFKPSCPEEKEAVFTLPDGEVVTLTANQSFQWEITSDTWKKMIELNDGFTPYSATIVAKSEYRKNNINYKNQGYVKIRLNETNIFRYNEGNHSWYYYSWPENPELTVRDNVPFSVTNLTVGNGYEDNAYSVAYNGYGYNYYDGDSSERSFTIIADRVVSETESVTEDYSIYLYWSQILWAGCNNTLRFEFKPQYINEKEIVVTMPDNQQIIVTPENSSFEWTLDNDVISRGVSWYDGQYLLVKAESKFEEDGINYENQGYVFITVEGGYPRNRNLYYEPTNRKWLVVPWLGE